ncbi:MAG: hypothetical protein AB7S26_22260 [Sandaracinaceae bacterium]
MSARDKDANERKRVQRLSNARQLASAGFVEHAVKQYLLAKEPTLAAKLFVEKGRLVDAIQLLSKSTDRESQLALAAYLVRAGDERGSAKVMAALGKLSDAETARYAELSMAGPKSAPPRLTPEPPIRRSTPTGRGVGAPKPGSPGAARIAADLSQLTRAAVKSAQARAAATRADPSPSQRPPPAEPAAPMAKTTPVAGQRPASDRAITPPYDSAPPTVDDIDLEVDLGEINAGAAADIDIDVDLHAPSSSESAASERNSARPRPDGFRTPSRPAGLASSPLPPKRSGFYNRRSEKPPSDAELDATLQQLIVGGRTDAAAKVAAAAGRHELAVAWFTEVGDRCNAGLSLAELGRPRDAIAMLLQVPRDHADYRAACRAMAKCAAALGGLAELGTSSSDVMSYLAAYAESGARSAQELASFLDLAEMLWALGDRRRAQRCLDSVIRLDPDEPTAQLMRLAWMTTGS